ncbi:MAG: hypothetical protein SAJ12_01340 [Jaaginema sp. PMC 1079.18]|nr:hypothetical protein [Jaaginema sp. PMC 1080.18]MEC4849629.1 hypothetical protein [Jaaginema sp. PMC 1079.18]MEC4864673.1 hypothetical protein [Jaaginema sp. PMC 1078.18]
MKVVNLVLGLCAISVVGHNFGTLKANAQTTNDWVDGALGRYSSQIFNAGMLSSGTTEFQESWDGSLGGNYTMREGGQIVSGTLSECVATKVQVMRCLWKDRYGEGYLEVTFTEDFTNFNGYWGTLDSEPLFRWSGSR